MKNWTPFVRGLCNWHVISITLLCFVETAWSQQFVVENQHKSALSYLSYEWIENPFYLFPDKTNAEITVTLPMQETNSIADFVKSYTHKNAHFSDDQWEFGQVFTPTIRMGIPIFDGVFYIGMQKNLALQLHSAIDQALLDYSFANDHHALNMNGSYSASAALDMDWKHYTIGFTLPWGHHRLYLFLHKHFVQLQGNSFLQGNVYGHLEQTHSGKTESLDFNYSPADFLAKAMVQYKGDAWSAELGWRWKNLIVRTRMSLEVAMEGFYQIEHNIPFFMDPLTQRIVYQAAQLLEDEPRQKFLQEETNYTHYETNTKMIYSIPVFFSLSWFYTSQWEFVFARSQGKLGSSFVAEPEIPRAWDLRNHLKFGTTPRHMLLSRLHLSWSQWTVGLVHLEIESSEQEKFSQSMNKIPFIQEFLKTPVLPVLQVKTSLGKKVRFTTGFDMLPVRRLSVGVYYGF
jgi:hypothetical protein